MHISVDLDRAPGRDAIRHGGQGCRAASRVQSRVLTCNRNKIAWRVLGSHAYFGGFRLGRTARPKFCPAPPSPIQGQQASSAANSNSAASRKRAGSRSPSAADLRMRSANEVLSILACCSGRREDHAPSSVCLKRATVSRSKYTGSLPPMVISNIFWNALAEPLTENIRSEERRVGKECRSR